MTGSMLLLVCQIAECQEWVRFKTGVLQLTLSLLFTRPPVFFKGLPCFLTHGYSSSAIFLESGHDALASFEGRHALVVDLSRLLALGLYLGQQVPGDHHDTVCVGHDIVSRMDRHGWVVGVGLHGDGHVQCRGTGKRSCAHD